ncbi:hypothetical protein XU18_0402 [Perkinsela sp. CCAP 1560/4]|nr:hypothetical protein XU18_0402 [Perkinsela sp. CCAP 1560/4]|eukprot:KNH09717.1 hypothetical protein XU18_0402 [Perkinsela sp. CCAP 1560/4]
MNTMSTILSKFSLFASFFLTYRMFHTRRFVGTSPKFASGVFSNAQKRMIGATTRQMNNSILMGSGGICLVSPKSCLLSTSPVLSLGSFQKTQCTQDCLGSIDTSQAVILTLVSLFGDISTMTWNTILSMLSIRCGE